MPAKTEWQALQAFVQRYGGDLFHARFLTLANLRGILHRGVGAYLDYLRRQSRSAASGAPARRPRTASIRREDAVRRLEVVLQAVVENYEEYKDYNTTTTQSDYGENLHVLLEFLRLKAALRAARLAVPAAGAGPRGAGAARPGRGGGAAGSSR